MNFFSRLIQLMRWADILPEAGDAFPSRAARIKLWEHFYQGLSSNCSLREFFMSTFADW